MRLFIKSYEDHTFIGREVGEAKLAKAMDFTEIMEFLKSKGVGEFIYYENYRQLLENEKDEDAYVIGETIDG